MANQSSDDRSRVKNPITKDFKASQDNRSKQLNTPQQQQQSGGKESGTQKEG